MRKFNLAAAAIILVLAASVAVAQDSKSSSTKEPTIEELFLKSAKFLGLREQAFSDDYEVKMDALGELEKMIGDSGSSKDAAQIEFILEYLSMEGSLHIVRENKRQINNFFEVRRKATELLGKLGTPDAMRACIMVLLSDQDPNVKSEAAFALGVIGLNDNNEAVNAIVFALQKDDPAHPNPNFGMAVCLALEKIGKKTGGIKDPAAYRALVKIAQGSYDKTTKAKAMQVLDALGLD